MYELVDRNFIGLLCVKTYMFGKGSFQNAFMRKLFQSLPKHFINFVTTSAKKKYFL